MGGCHLLDNTIMIAVVFFWICRAYFSTSCANGLRKMLFSLRGSTSDTAVWVLDKHLLLKSTDN